MQSRNTARSPFFHHRRQVFPEADKNKSRISWINNAARCGSKARLSTYIPAEYRETPAACAFKILNIVVLLLQADVRDASHDVIQCLADFLDRRQRRIHTPTRSGVSLNRHNVHAGNRRPAPRVEALCHQISTVHHISPWRRLRHRRRRWRSSSRFSIFFFGSDLLAATRLIRSSRALQR